MEGEIGGEIGERDGGASRHTGEHVRNMLHANGIDKVTAMRGSQTEQSELANQIELAKASEPIELLAAQLVEWFRSTASDYVVALSGGVDSAVVAKAASLAGEVNTVLVTGESPSLARQELRDAISVAERVALPHVTLATGETKDPAYQANDARRCYHCKTHLFSSLEKQYPSAIIVTGTNADDLQDYRPGLQAASEHRVRAPLAELGFDKQVVRRLAELWGLPIAEKPASPCLASRVAYGVEVTHERLLMIERAEQWLRERGLIEFRVRLHAGELARIEVPLKELQRLASEPIRTELNVYFKSIGFRFVTLDLSGFSSGSLNQLIQLDQLKR